MSLIKFAVNFKRKEEEIQLNTYQKKITLELTTNKTQLYNNNNEFFTNQNAFLLFSLFFSLSLFFLFLLCALFGCLFVHSVCVLQKCATHCPHVHGFWIAGHTNVIYIGWKTTTRLRPTWKCKTATTRGESKKTTKKKQPEEKHTKRKAVNFIPHSRQRQQNQRNKNRSVFFLFLIWFWCVLVVKWPSLH